MPPATSCGSAVGTGGDDQRNIHISQSATCSGPPPPPTLYCTSLIASLGALPAGRYDLTWGLAASAGLRTIRRFFQVQEVAAVPALQWPLMAALGAALVLLGTRLLER